MKCTRHELHHSVCDGLTTCHYHVGRMTNVQRTRDYGYGRWFDQLVHASESRGNEERHSQARMYELFKPMAVSVVGRRSTPCDILYDVEDAIKGQADRSRGVQPTKSARLSLSQRLFSRRVHVIIPWEGRQLLLLWRNFVDYTMPRKVTF